MRGRAPPRHVRSPAPPVGRRSNPVGAARSLPSRTGGTATGFARRAVEAARERLPFLERIQAAIGPRHDLTTLRIVAGPAADAANRALGSEAFTFGDAIAFRRPPDLRTAAHEATHAVQQRARAGGEPSPAEREELEGRASDVADRVVAGARADGLLPAPRSGRGTATIQALDVRSAEVERAVNEMWQLVSTEDAPGTEVEFLYFTSGAAMTLVEFRRTRAGTGSAPPVSLDEFQRRPFHLRGGSAFGAPLVVWVGETQRYLRIALSRDRSGWTLERYAAEEPSKHPSVPPEGRTVPHTGGSGFPADVWIRAQRQVAGLAPLLVVPRGGTATFEFAVRFDDDRVQSVDILRVERRAPERGTGGVKDATDPGASVALLNAVLAFSQGLGPRTIRFRLEGAAPAPDREARWRVAEASTDRGEQPLPDEAAAIVGDYRRMHAEIMAQWRSGVKEAAVYAGMLGVEQLAWWLIGGVVTRVLGAAFGAVAPRLVKFVRASSKGGSRAGAEYLETMIARLSTAEREEMVAIARRAETEGLEALSKVERGRLGTLLRKLEDLIEAPLTTAEKDTLRGRMTARFVGGKPAVQAAFDTARREVRIHHRVPLEYAHFFPGRDPNAAANLIGLEIDVHVKGVNAVWTRLRTSAPAGKIDGNVVARVADIVDRHFGKWYDRVPASSAATLASDVAAAKEAALKAVDALVATL